MNFTNRIESFSEYADRVEDSGEPIYGVDGFRGIC